MGDYGISGNNSQFQGLFKYFWVLSFKEAKTLCNQVPNEASGKTLYHKA